MSLLLNESTAMHLGDFIDCRYLTLSLEFYELEQSHTQLLVFDMLEWINLLLSDRFIASWKINNRGVSTKSLPSQARKVLQETSINLLQLNAFWKSEKINTKQQLEQWHRFIQRESCLMGWPQSGWSVDFADYWNDHILPYAKDKAALRMALKQLFLEKDRHLVGVCYTPDVDCAIFLNTLDDTSNLRHGQIRLSASAFALADSLPETAEKWKEILITFSEKYKNLDGRVMLQPKTLAYASPYMTYFDDGQKNFRGYLPGVEWANVLSPRAQGMIQGQAKNDPCGEIIQCKPINGGGLLLASQRSILEYDVDDALLMKSWAKGAIYPGPGLGYSLPLIMRPAHLLQAHVRLPRKDWAIVPILEDEIEILGSQLSFSSKAI